MDKRVDKWMDKRMDKRMDGWRGGIGYLSGLLVRFTRPVELVDFVGKLFKFRNDELAPEGSGHEHNVLVDRSVNCKRFHRLVSDNQRQPPRHQFTFHQEANKADGIQQIRHQIPSINHSEPFDEHSEKRSRRRWWRWWRRWRRWKERTLWIHCDWAWDFQCFRALLCPGRAGSSADWRWFRWVVGPCSSIRWPRVPITSQNQKKKNVNWQTLTIDGYIKLETKSGRILPLT